MISDYEVPIVTSSYFSLTSGEKAIREFLMNNPRLTAIMASNDIIAISVIKLGYDMGIRIRSELAVIDIDEIPITSFSVFALSTIYSKNGVIK